jgi:hypothetical protein
VAKSLQGAAASRTSSVCASEVDRPASPPISRTAASLESAAGMASHASTRTTQIYDRQRVLMKLRRFRFEQRSNAVLFFNIETSPRSAGDNRDFPASLAIKEGR